MTMTLKEVLRTKVQAFEAENEKNKGVISEWQAAIAKLLGQFREWLAASDPEKILEIQELKKEISEPGLGQYTVSRMDIRAFGKWIGILPKARRTIRKALPPQSGAPEQATGRVDITDEVRRYILYRFTKNNVDNWFIEGPDAGALKPLNQEAFEAALTSYFK